MWVTNANTGRKTKRPFSFFHISFSVSVEYPRGRNAPILPFLSLSELTDSSPPYHSAPVCLSASTPLLSWFLLYFTEPFDLPKGDASLASSPHAEQTIFSRSLLCRVYTAHTLFKVIYSRLSSRCAYLHRKGGRKSEMNVHKMLIFLYF